MSLTGLVVTCKIVLLVTKEVGRRRLADTAGVVVALAAAAIFPSAVSLAGLA